MIMLKKLSIISLIDKALKKQYEFHAGINIILGDKPIEEFADSVSKEANGAGKTTMVESLRYLLGNSLPSAFENRPLLAEKDLFLTLEVQANGKSIILGRMINSPDYGFYSKYDKITLDLLNNWVQLEDKDYKKYVQDIFMGELIDKETPSFSSIREYLIRDEKLGFNNIVLTSRNAIINYKILAYLSELPFNAEKEIQAIKKLQKEKNDSLKQIDALTNNITELKLQEKKIQSEINRLSNVLSKLNMADKIEDTVSLYNEVKAKLSKVQRQIFELENIKLQYRKNINDLQQKVSEIKALNDIEPFYKQLIDYFPDKVGRNFQELQTFYGFMVENRGKYFLGKIEDLERELKQLNAQKIKLQETLSNSTQLINSKDIFADLNIVSEELKQKSQELAEIKFKIDFYNKKSEITNEINKIKQDIIKMTEIKHDEFLSVKEKTTKITAIFDTLMKESYNEEGVLEHEYDNRTGLNDTTGRIKIKCEIPDENSHGRLYMKINMFDLSWFLSRVDNNNTVGPLVHDGSYCKPDKEVKFKLLKYVNDYLGKTSAGQYIITANNDEFEEQAIQYFKDNKLIIAELNRKDGHQNRFFGFKF